ncbi:MAG: aminoglycoside phosphotransferase family protein [Spongiibacteraceae bacterium]
MRSIICADTLRANLTRREKLFSECKLDVPSSLEQALDPQWLQQALAEISGGANVVDVKTVDTLETMAAKVRIAVRFSDNTTQHFCLKAFFNPDIARGAGVTAIREARFYERIAPHISVRTPRAIAHIDDEKQHAILIMEDLIHAGAHFCSALEPFTVEMAAQSLDQLARLHAAKHLLDGNDWIPFRLSAIAKNPHFTVEKLQELMDGPRCAKLSRHTSDAALLLAGMKALAARFAKSSTTIMHGDCHAGNFYLTKQGPGLTDWQLLQRGNCLQDVAYHIAAILPEEVAEREERALLNHYLDCLRAHGAAASTKNTAPTQEEAWGDYRLAQLYGFYHWAITTRVEPEIINIFMTRLGAGIERHRTYSLLGLV